MPYMFMTTTEPRHYRDIKFTSHILQLFDIVKINPTHDFAYFFNVVVIVR